MIMSFNADIVARTPKKKPFFWPEQIAGYEYMYTYQRKIDTFNAGLSGTPTTPRAGQSEGGYTFIGGDPSNPNSWRKN